MEQTYWTIHRGHDKIINENKRIPAKLFQSELEQSFIYQKNA